MTTAHDEMRALVDDLPNQMEAGWERSRSVDLPETHRDVSAVVVAGMGGSAMGADLAAALFAGDLRVPLVVVRDYGLPGWAGERSLFVASSFSGDTEETLAAFEAAGRRGLRRVAVTSGGILAERAMADGVPLVRLRAPGPPRAALGASLAALAGVLSAAGAMPDPTEALRAGAAAMRSLVAAEHGWPSGTEADRIAAMMMDRVPVIVAPQQAEAVARRWKTQLAENAKMTAAWDALPEMNHNSVVGYAHPPALGERLAVVFLSAPARHARLLRRVAVTIPILEAAGIPHAQVEAPDGTWAAQVLWLVQLGDLVSLRVAARYGVDPMPVAAIDRLKAALLAADHAG